jgi:YidC/Oxa1 family membrane protein insertase
MPTPGSEAYDKWEQRQAARNQRKGIATKAEVEDETESNKPAQRQQPVGKNRAKRGKGKK